jgi:hypothetical protein
MIKIPFVLSLSKDGKLNYGSTSSPRTERQAHHEREDKNHHEREDKNHHERRDRNQEIIRV